MSRKKILFISLGCDKNLVDSEKMLALLAGRGYEFTDDEAQSDIIVINTCCFINDAKQESIDTILEMAKLRENGDIQALVVTGCLAQRYREEIQKEIPEVDMIIGTAAIDEIAQALDDYFDGKRENYYRNLDTKPWADTGRIVTTGGHYAYLKIAEGCDKHCTYCIIPKVRGNYRSIPMENLLKEAEALAEGGVKELILVAQETTVYGVDLYGKKTLPELLRNLCRIESLHWIRILYCYPEEIDDALIQVIKEEPKICHYLDLPIQHGCDTILKRMGRRTNRKELIEIVEKLRANIPDICIRTTLITGFPGETDKEHEELLDFVEQMEFDRLGVFTYSQEEDTPAASMPEQIDEDIKEERRRQLMQLQQKIAFDMASAMEGKVVEAMIEGKVADEDAYVARTYKDAPNVDGFLFINTTRQFMSGDFVKCRITGTYEYDLIGELEDEPAQ
ncbi:MAG: 30S ribosomal protein S12 methylthiotransferase RimO [Bacillus sp. (in: Bacteria)]|nr:30S ribosomal protein S12 methylthiotransferase RimO [Bacillus sp. (in: firmicutes)]MCM1425140.1 30S ribosomal protein S12 methylthiotransferase RimO [Eubacterium sp.]